MVMRKIYNILESPERKKGRKTYQNFDACILFNNKWAEIFDSSREIRLRKLIIICWRSNKFAKFNRIVSAYSEEWLVWKEEIAFERISFYNCLLHSFTFSTAALSVIHYRSFNLETSFTNFVLSWKKITRNSLKISLNNRNISTMFQY